MNRLHSLDAPPPPSILDQGDAGHPWGAVVVGSIHPFVYVYELETAVWHWMGRLTPGAEDSIEDLADLSAAIVRSRCTSYFRRPTPAVLEVYASVTPKVEQRMCLDCRFSPDDEPPTLYRGNEKMVP